MTQNVRASGKMFALHEKGSHIWKNVCIKKFVQTKKGLHIMKNVCVNQKRFAFHGNVCANQKKVRASCKMFAQTKKGLGSCKMPMNQKPASSYCLACKVPQWLASPLLFLVVLLWRCCSFLIQFSSAKVSLYGEVFPYWPDIVVQAKCLC